MGGGLSNVSKGRQIASKSRSKHIDDTRYQALRRRMIRLSTWEQRLPGRMSADESFSQRILVFQVALIGKQNFKRLQVQVSIVPE